MRKVFLSFLPLLLLGPLAAQQPRLHMELPGLSAHSSEVTDVTLDGAVLRLGLAFLNHDSDLTEQDRSTLDKLKGIYVKTFEFDHAPRLTDPALASLRQQLQGTGWTRIVTVRSKRYTVESDNSEIYVCTARDGTILGMAILTRAPDELTVVNIVGAITPEEVTKLGGNLGIPKTGSNN